MSEKRRQNRYKEDVDNFSVGKLGGIVQDRGCSDILMLLVFIAYVGGMVALTQKAYKEG